MQGLAGAVFVGCSLGECYLFDRLVRRQYEIAREAWEADDQPTGFGWLPPRDPDMLFWVKESGMRSWARDRAFRRWMFSSPPWILADPEARRLQTRLRQVFFVAMGAWATLMVGIFLF
jgi:hypothetical protein